MIVQASFSAILIAVCFCVALGTVTDASALRLMTAYVVVGNLTFWLFIARHLFRGRHVLRAG